jgi:signal transduction histidine kinase
VQPVKAWILDLRHAIQFMTTDPVASMQNWHVVVVDDSPDDRVEMRRLLLRGSDRRYTFTEASTGAAGILAVQKRAVMPDCVILDYNLPDMNALEVLVGLAGTDGLPICPVVVLTGGPDSEVGRLVLRAGAQDYIAKDGLTPLALTRIVENSIERLTMGRELLGRNEALLRTKKILSEASQRKDEFIATLAHELRNPMAPICTGLRVLRMSKDASTSQRTMDIMERQLGRMTRLIDDLLDISRITSGKVLLRLRQVTLSDVVGEAIEAALPLLDGGHHTLKVDLPEVPLWLEVDPVRIAQVIENLLSNSAKYSEDGSSILLSARREGAEVVIQVADTGLGIPADMLGQVFEMFAQVNLTLSRSQGGLGIGLSLVREFVEIHGGTVTAESAGVGHGSTFSIRLPSATSIADVVPDLSPSAPLSQVGRRILVVDDNEDSALTLAAMLSLSGHVARTAFTGQQALSVGAQFLPEIVFLDIGLPGMNGYEVAQRFRTIAVHKDVLLVALTGWGSESDRLKSVEAGFDLHLTKPADFSAVAALLACFDAIRSGRSKVE